jgi:hypothetical protein
MRTKIVLWGITEKEEKVLVAIELVEAENIVKTYLIEEKDATEIFYNRMLNEWRYESEIEFPENTKIHENPLTLSEEILPAGIKVDRPDLIIRAKTEWHFVVLSKKLYDLYNSELEDFTEKINDLSEFDHKMWEELKGFWAKVQTQIREKNLFRNHIDSLRKQTDSAFRQLKDLKKQAEKDLREDSKKHYSSFQEIIEKVEEKIEGGLGLQPIFEELKEIQEKFKKTNFSRDHRKQLWDRLDKAFKTIKEKRYGNSNEEKSPFARLQRRYDGLIVAIEKMDRSISRDKRDLNQQDRKAASSFGQLELEIRKVKMSMVEERVQSKEEKMKDMLKTKTMLESRLKSEMEKEEKRKAFEDAKKEAEDKIAMGIQERTEEMGDKEDELMKAAEKISEIKEEEKKAKADKKGLLERLADKVEDVMEDVMEEAKELAEDAIDTVKAVAEVVEDKVEEKFEGTDEKMDDLKEKLEEKAKIAKEKISDVVDKLGDKMEELEDKIEEKIKSEPSGIGAKITEVADSIEEKMDDAVDKIKDKVKKAMADDEEE